jgi:hypothetical protein
LRKTNKTGRWHKEFELVARAITKLKAVHSNSELDLDNLEAVFITFEMARLIQLCPGLSEDEIAYLPIAFRGVIAHTLEELITYKYDGEQVLPTASYSSFARLLSQLRPRYSCTIITFNYDLALV